MRLQYLLQVALIEHNIIVSHCSIDVSLSQINLKKKFMMYITHWDLSVLSSHTMITINSILSQSINNRIHMGSAE